MYNDMRLKAIAILFLISGIIGIIVSFITGFFSLIASIIFLLDPNMDSFSIIFYHISLFTLSVSNFIFYNKLRKNKHNAINGSIVISFAWVILLGINMITGSISGILDYIFISLFFISGIYLLYVKVKQFELGGVSILNGGSEHNNKRFDTYFHWLKDDIIIKIIAILYLVVGPTILLLFTSLMIIASYGILIPFYILPSVLIYVNIANGIGLLKYKRLSRVYTIALSVIYIVLIWTILVSYDLIRWTDWLTSTYVKAIIITILNVFILGYMLFSRNVRNKFSNKNSVYDISGKSDADCDEKIIQNDQSNRNYENITIKAISILYIIFIPSILLFYNVILNYNGLILASTVFAIVNIINGIGLWIHKNWSRIITIVLSNFYIVLVWGLFYYIGDHFYIPVIVTLVNVFISDYMIHNKNMRK